MVKSAISNLKEGKGADLHQSFAFPITTYPLSLATPDGNLRQGTKSLLRNYMIEQANAVIEHPLFYARWIYNGMAILRILKPKSTYRELMESLINVITPSSRSCPITIEMVNYIYLQDSMKNQTRKKRGSTSVRTHLNSLEQKMLQ